MRNTVMSVFSRNLQLGILATHCSNGKIRIYSGTKPNSAEEMSPDAVLLAELNFSAIAFDNPAYGKMTARTISPEADARADGKATWFRVFKSDGVTPLWDGTVGLEARNPVNAPNMVLSDVEIRQHAIVSLESFTHELY